MKSLWQSKTFWAGALGFGASLAGLIGMRVDAARAAELAEILPLLVANITSAASVIFRIMADARIGAKAKNVGADDAP